MNVKNGIKRYLLAPRPCCRLLNNRVQCEGQDRSSCKETDAMSLMTKTTAHLNKTIGKEGPWRVFDLIVKVVLLSIYFHLIL